MAWFNRVEEWKKLEDIRKEKEKEIIANSSHFSFNPTNGQQKQQQHRQSTGSDYEKGSN